MRKIIENSKCNNDNIYEWQILRLADGERNPIGNNINLPNDLINECLGVSLIWGMKGRGMKGRRLPKTSLCVYIA